MDDHCKQWYVLQVPCGQERSLAQRIVQLGDVQTLVPIEPRTIRRRGEWTTKEYVLFAGYIFVRLAYNWARYYQIAALDRHIRILGGGQNPTAVTLAEMARVTDLSQLITEISVVQFGPDGSYEVLSGALKELCNHIVRMHRRQKRADVQIPFRWGYKQITLSFCEAPQGTAQQTLCNSQG